MDRYRAALHTALAINK